MSINRVMSRKTNDDTTEEEKKLVKEIYYLRSAISDYGFKLQSLKYSDVAAMQNLPTSLLSDAREKVHCVPDVHTILNSDLYKCAGVECARVGEEFVFLFSTVVGQEKEIYSVQIMNNEGCGQLGKWTMPMSANMCEILKEQPLGDINNIRNFVKLCKYYIDCYTHRAGQFYELKEYLLDAKNMTVETNMGYTGFVLLLSGIMHCATQQTYDNILYLFYKPKEVLPYILKIEPMNTNHALSVNEMEMFNKYFKYFKKCDLSTAFVKTMRNRNTFVMEKIVQEEIPVIDIEDDDDTDAVEFLNIVRRKKNGGKNGKKKGKSNNQKGKNGTENNNSEDSMAARADEVSDNLSDMTQGTIDGNESPKRSAENAFPSDEQISKKTAKKTREKLNRKQRTLDFSKSLKEPSNSGVSKKPANKNIVAHETEVTNATLKRLHSQRKSMKNSDNNAKNNEESTASGFQTTEAKENGNVVKELSEISKDNERAGNTVISNKKHRKSVRWDLEKKIMPCSSGENLTKGVNELMNSTPFSETTNRPHNLPPCFDDMSEIVKAVKRPSENRTSTADKRTNDEDAKENSPESDSTESEIIENQAELLKDLVILKEKDTVNWKNKKSARQKNEKLPGKKSIKKKKNKRL